MTTPASPPEPSKPANLIETADDLAEEVSVRVNYGAYMGFAVELMLQAARETNRVFDSWVNFIIHCRILDPEMRGGNVRSNVLKNLWRLFRQHNIEIPFTQRDINLRDNEQVQTSIEALGTRN